MDHKLHRKDAPDNRTKNGYEKPRASYNDGRSSATDQKPLAARHWGRRKGSHPLRRYRPHPPHSGAIQSWRGRNRFVGGVPCLQGLASSHLKSEHLPAYPLPPNLSR